MYCRCSHPTWQIQATALWIGDREIAVLVSKTLSLKARRIGALDVRIVLSAELNARRRRKVLAAARACPVHRSLSSEVVVTVDVQHGEVGQAVWPDKVAAGDSGGPDGAGRVR